MFLKQNTPKISSSVVPVREKICFSTDLYVAVDQNVFIQCCFLFGNTRNHRVFVAFSQTKQMSSCAFLFVGF